MDFVLNLLIVVSMASIMAVSLNYIVGYAGIVSIAHASFAGIGAYAVAILSKDFGWNFFLAVFVAFLITALVAWLISFPVLKLKGDSLMLVTFGFAIIIFNVMLNWRDLTGGALGIKGVPVPEFFGIDFANKFNFLLLCLFFLVVTILVFWLIVKSPYGTVIRGIRENPVVMESAGYNTKQYQRSVFVLGSAFAVFYGALFATHISFIEPGSFDLLASVFILVMIILGGLGNIYGSVLGAVIIVVFPELLRFLGLPSSIMAETQQILYGLLLVVLMYLRPQGLIGNYKV